MILYMRRDALFRLINKAATQHIDIERMPLVVPLIRLPAALAMTHYLRKSASCRGLVRAAGEEIFACFDACLWLCRDASAAFRGVTLYAREPAARHSNTCSRHFKKIIYFLSLICQPDRYFSLHAASVFPQMRDIMATRWFSLLDASWCRAAFAEAQYCRLWTRRRRLLKRAKNIISSYDGNAAAVPDNDAYITSLRRLCRSNGHAKQYLLSHSDFKGFSALFELDAMPSLREGNIGNAGFRLVITPVFYQKYINAFL